MLVRFQILQTLISDVRCLLSTVQLKHSLFIDISLYCFSFLEYLFDLSVRPRTSNWLKWMSKVLRSVSLLDCYDVLHYILYYIVYYLPNSCNVHGLIFIICGVEFCGCSRFKTFFCPCAEHCWGVSMLHLHGETEGCSPLSTLLQTLLLQLYTSESV